ncbi:alpha/beta fold hydrolase [Pseudodonghicola flavimaris]|uniref:Alpha/beta hydrolase n=1 Tax=Pseudodonghicola flavimaris TaxID=3050036 RepID=A0ABT7EYV3_9RHOB|nr:alpha/beta hydrolase [Pseudodonghicola flavimaris]MDK3017435.1 alpha/beta hydrolase [Pseudodonghicola flavimaris]
MKDMNDLPQPVFVRELGTGDRRLLAVHCTLAHSGVWRGLAQALDGQARLTAFDMLSHGRSPDWDGQGDIQDRTLDTALGLLDEPMDVIGHSFGATVALRLAVARPDLVRSLTLIEPVYFAFALQSAPEAVARHEADAAPFTEALARGEVATGARLFNRMWGGGVGPRWDALPEAARASMIRGIPLVPACRQALYDDPAGVAAPGGLDAVTMPVLLMRGCDSHPVISAITDAIAARLTRVRQEAVPGAGHMLPITHPEAVAAAMRGVFADAPLPGAA